MKDAASGNDFGRRETSDGETVRGEYRVQLPDGRTQIVTYTADWRTGFHADVRYEGEAQYPDQYNTGNQAGYNANAQGQNYNNNNNINNNNNNNQGYNNNGNNFNNNGYDYAGSNNIDTGYNNNAGGNFHWFYIYLQNATFHEFSISLYVDYFTVNLVFCKTFSKKKTVTHKLENSVDFFFSPGTFKVKFCFYVSHIL